MDKMFIPTTKCTYGLELGQLPIGTIFLPSDEWSTSECYHDRFIRIHGHKSNQYYASVMPLEGKHAFRELVMGLKEKPRMILNLHLITEGFGDQNEILF